MDGMELYLVTITRVHAILIALSSCVCSRHLFYVYVSLICLRFVILGDKTDAGSVWWHWQGWQASEVSTWRPETGTLGRRRDGGEKKNKGWLGVGRRPDRAADRCDILPDCRDSLQKRHPVERLLKRQTYVLQR